MEQKTKSNARSLVIFLGLSFGFIMMTLMLPGGYDSFNYYLQSWRPTTTAPGIAQLFFEPINLLPAFPSPLRWTALVVLTIAATRWTTVTLNTRWWIAFLSFPFLWMIWHGQIEIFPLVGVTLGWLVIHRGWHPAWFGLAVLFLVIKVQVGYGIVVLYAWWLVKNSVSWRPFAWAVVSAGGIVLITMIAYPGWIGYWLQSLGDLHPQTRYFNASIFFPFSLVAWVIAVWPAEVGHLSRLRLFAAATLLGSPYFANYHCTTLMAMTNNRWLLAVSWVPLIPMIAFPEAQYTWSQKFAWIIPVAVIAVEVWGIYQTRESQQPMHVRDGMVDNQKYKEEAI